MWVANGKAKNFVPPSLLVSVAVTLIISIADTPPKFEVAVSCNAEGAIDQAMELAVSLDYQSCMDDEESARTELAKGWSTYSADAKVRCVGRASVGEVPSYVETLECVLVTVNVSSDSAGHRKTPKRKIKGNR